MRKAEYYCRARVFAVSAHRLNLLLESPPQVVLHGLLRGRLLLAGPDNAGTRGEGRTRIVTCIENLDIIETILIHRDTKAPNPEATRRPTLPVATPAKAIRTTEAAAARRAEIAKAVEQADARLAKLPLPGGIFVDRNGRAKFEFRERNRVYVTLFDEVMEAGYDVDGDRVIVRLPGTNQVYTRQGAWIRGNGLDLKRQAE